MGCNWSSLICGTYLLISSWWLLLIPCGRYASARHFLPCILWCRRHENCQNCGDKRWIAHSAGFIFWWISECLSDGFLYCGMTNDGRCRGRLSRTHLKILSLLETRVQNKERLEMGKYLILNQILQTRQLSRVILRRTIRQSCCDR